MRPGRKLPKRPCTKNSRGSQTAPFLVSSNKNSRRPGFQVNATEVCFNGRGVQRDAVARGLRIASGTALIPSTIFPSRQRTSSSWLSISYSMECSPARGLLASPYGQNIHAARE
jgi:hypothetical protein